MGSGFYPLSPHDYEGRKLAEARIEIRGVIDGWYESRSYLNAEDACSDQVYIARLLEAISAIDECIQPDESDIECARRQVSDAELMRNSAEARIEKWHGIVRKLEAQKISTAIVGAIDNAVKGAGDDGTNDPS